MNIILGHLKTNKQKANKQRGKQPTSLLNIMISLDTRKQTNKKLINKEENNQPISPTLLANFFGGEIADRVSLLNIILGHLQTK